MYHIMSMYRVFSTFSRTVQRLKVRHEASLVGSDWGLDRIEFEDQQVHPLESWLTCMTRSGVCMDVACLEGL